MLGQCKSFFLQEAELLAELGLRAVTSQVSHRSVVFFLLGSGYGLAVQCQTENAEAIY